MCAVPNTPVLCSSLISCLPSMLLSYCLSDFEMVPVAPLITGNNLLSHSTCTEFILLDLYILKYYLLLYYYYYYRISHFQLWLGNIHLSWDVVINRIRLGGLICIFKSFLQLNMCQELQILAVVFGCKLSLVRLCDSDFGIIPVDDITIGITCAAFSFHITHISFASSWYLFCLSVIVLARLCVFGTAMSIKTLCFVFLSINLCQVD